MSDPKKQQRFERRKIRIRKKVNGTGERPRLNVFRSNSCIYAQIIDDFQRRTLVSASSNDSNVRGKASDGGKTGVAKAVGVLLAERAKAHNISSVVFDRGGRIFHGRVKALAEGCREGGLNF